MWARLGAAIIESTVRRTAAWGSVTRMIEVVRQLMKAEAMRLQSLIESSSNKLNPLSEPFESDLGLHRWLGGEREEAYSDWLQWVLMQAQTPRRVYQLFGLQPPDELQAKELLDVKREYRVPEGHAEQEGRLDLVVSYGDKATLVIEIKKESADDSDTDKHSGYDKWVQQQPHRHKAAVLVAASAQRKNYVGFTFCSWEQVCIQMRLLSIELCKDNRVMQAAMVLAFAAAVEQNILRFSVHLSTTCRFIDPRVADFLERFLQHTGAVRA